MRARRGRPLKWCAERMEEFLAASHGRDVRSKAELALDANGRVLALRVDSLANVGAYATPGGVAIPLLIGPWVSTSIYDIGAIDLRIMAGDDPYIADERLSWRGSAGGYRYHRAPDGRRRAQDRH